MKSRCRDCESTLRKLSVTLPCTRCSILVTIRKDTLLWCGGTSSTPLCTSCQNKDRIVRGQLQLGPNNPNWKGGATSEADKFYNSREWKEIRAQAFIRDHYTCVDCGQVGRKLEANHIKPRSKHPQLKLILSNIETLCKKCHDGKKWMVYVD